MTNGIRGFFSLLTGIGVGLVVAGLVSPRSGAANRKLNSGLHGLLDACLAPLPEPVPGSSENSLQQPEHPIKREQKP